MRFVRLPSRTSIHASPLRLAPGGSSPISASDSIVLPEPDSPTIPSVSPSASVNDTSFTGRIHPASVGISTVSAADFQLRRDGSQHHNIIGRTRAARQKIAP